MICQEIPDKSHLGAWSALYMAIEHFAFDTKLSVFKEDQDKLGGTEIVPLEAPFSRKGQDEDAPTRFYSAAMAETLLRLQANFDEIILTSVHNESRETISKILPSGVLIVGGPGSGKSSLLRNIAKSKSNPTSKIKTMEIASTSLITKEVGASERNLANIFEMARTKASEHKITILLLCDDIDQLFPSDLESAYGQQRYPTVTRRLLGVFLRQSEMLEGSGVVLVATASDRSLVHRTLCRSGRLEETIFFP